MDVRNKKGFKTIFYGGSTVGKSTIILRLRDNKFYDNLSLTVGLSFVKLIRNDKAFDIWDTAGQERFYSLAPMYFRDASVEIFVFDVMDLEKINVLKIYGRHAQTLNRNKIIVVGNKIDLLKNSEDLIDIHEHVKDKIEKLGMTEMIHDYVYISARSGVGIPQLLQVLDKYVDDIEEPSIVIPEVDENLVIVKNEETLQNDCVC